MHEAGIHVDGLMKDQRNYQSLNPQELGREHRMVLGKHSGTGLLRQTYADLGFELEQAQLELLLQQVRRYATTNKRSPDHGQLLAFLNDLQINSADSPLLVLQ